MDDTNFQWVTIDVESFMPRSWHSELMELSNDAKIIELTSFSVTSRECRSNNNKPRFLFLDGDEINKSCGWLTNLYHSKFLNLARRYFGNDVVSSCRSNSAIVLNALEGVEMRYESHVDSNPVTALLFVTTIESNRGGELIVSRDKFAGNISDIEKDFIAIYPMSGMLTLFNGRDWPHYVRPLREDGIRRVVVVMNYYNNSVGEDLRPADLDRHLGLAE